MGRQGRGDRRDRRRLRRHLAGRDRVSRLRPELLADRPNARRVPPRARVPLRPARTQHGGRLITLVGLALVLAGVWLPVDTSNDGTYWNVTGAGHSLGILFLILIGICALSVLAASRTRRRAANLLAAGAALVLFGLVLFVPVSSAFNQLDSLRAGAWLSLAGGAVLAVGTVMAWTSPARGPFE